MLSMIEHQCGMWPPFYLVNLGPFGMKIWNETDAASGTTIAWKIGAWEDTGLQTIWMVFTFTVLFAAACAEPYASAQQAFLRFPRPSQKSQL